jgi:hypothetical protein
MWFIEGRKVIVSAYLNSTGEIVHQFVNLDNDYLISIHKDKLILFYRALIIDYLGYGNT